MIRASLLLLLSAAGLMAQFVGDFLPERLVTYLEITDAQRRQIVQINAGFERFRGVKQERSSHVQVEIDREIREPNPDAMALGLRYRELEAIRREIDAEQVRTVDTIQALLTAVQKTKLAALQEVLRMQPTACDAVTHRLMAPAPLPPGNVIPANRVSPTFGAVLIPFSSNGGCGSGSSVFIPVFVPEL
ncbi:MAG: hypothetical protein SGI92_05490 [Bryobacteraceae bacterium]|nr:hypothetical protein [Bryobacteraceae bacterium]